MIYEDLICFLLETKETDQGLIPSIILLFLCFPTDSTLPWLINFQINDNFLALLYYYSKHLS